jgi:hypothetical protein
MIRTSQGEHVPASFFAPFERTVEPYIRVATGDFPSRKRKCGRHNALASVLCSIAHEIIHYQQWIDGEEMREREAIIRGLRLLRAYSKNTLRP